MSMPDDDRLRAGVDILLKLAAGRITQQQSFQQLFDVGIKQSEMELVLDLAQAVVTANKDADRRHDMDDPDTAVVCETCGELLHRFGADDETWIHSMAWKHVDHDAKPTIIPRWQVKTERCDFCGEPGKAAWVFVGSDIKSAVIGHDNKVIRMDDMGARWGACAICGPMVRAGNINRLVERHKAVSEAWKHVHAKDTREQQRAIIDNMRQMWGTFIPTITETHQIEPPREPAKLSARMMPKLQQGLVKFWNHPHILREMHRSRTERGITFSLPGVHYGNEDEFKIDFDPAHPNAANAWKNFTQHLIAGLWAADLYWISRKFTQLSVMAGHDFDKLSITREELPSTFGFLMYEDPIGTIKRPGGDAAIRGISWTLVPQGIWLNLYIQGEDKDPDVDVDWMRAEFGYLICPNNGSGFKFSDVIDASELTDEMQFMRTIYATWFLMVQPGVAEHSTAPVDKKYARSFQRAHNRKLPDVQLVDLRRQPHRPTGDAPDREGRKLTVRVYRKGHWKRQFYGPGRALRKTIYINGYIAGPDNAPLKQRPRTVKVLR